MSIERFPEGLFFAFPTWIIRYLSAFRNLLQNFLPIMKIARVVNRKLVNFVLHSVVLNPRCVKIMQNLITIFMFYGTAFVHCEILMIFNGFSHAVGSTSIEM